MSVLPTYAQEAEENLPRITTEVLPVVEGQENTVPGDFVVGPGKVEVTIPAGTSKTVELMVTNRIGEERVFSIETEDTGGSADLARPVTLYGDSIGPYTLKDYIAYPQTNFVLQHNQRARIPVTISVPADAEPGGLYGSVLITSVSDPISRLDENGAVPQSTIVARIGTLFFVTVPGEVETEGKLAQFDTLPPQTFFSGGPITFQLVFENSGSIHLNPYGVLHVTNMLGEEVGLHQIEPYFALPQSLRSREIEWTRQWLFGRYEATVELNRGYDDIIDTQTIVFWVLPWKIMLGVFVGLFIFLFLLRLFFSTFRLTRRVE